LSDFAGIQRYRTCEAAERNHIADRDRRNNLESKRAPVARNNAFIKPQESISYRAFVVTRVMPRLAGTVRPSRA